MAPGPLVLRGVSLLKIHFFSILCLHCIADDAKLGRPLARGEIDITWGASKKTASEDLSKRSTSDNRVLCYRPIRMALQTRFRVSDPESDSGRIVYVIVLSRVRDTTARDWFHNIWRQYQLQSELGCLKIVCYYA